MTCEDCATDCGELATWIVRDEFSGDREWFYCDDHAPFRDPGLVLLPVGA